MEKFECNALLFGSWVQVCDIVNTNARFFWHDDKR